MRMHAIVLGKVQGVWFRAWTRETAHELGLTGWVRNRPDGNVETTACGDEATLKKFEQRLWEGPPLARVTEIRIEWSEADEDFTTFDICR